MLLTEWHTQSCWPYDLVIDNVPACMKSSCLQLNADKTRDGWSVSSRQQQWILTTSLSLCTASRSALASSSRPHQVWSDRSRLLTVLVFWPDRSCLLTVLVFWPDRSCLMTVLVFWLFLSSDLTVLVFWPFLSSDRSCLLTVLVFWPWFLSSDHGSCLLIVVVFWPDRSCLLTVLVFCYRNNTAPTHLSRDSYCAVDNDSQRQRCSSSTNILVVPHTRLKVASDCAFHCAAACIWNDLVVNRSSSPQETLKTYLFNQ